MPVRRFLNKMVHVFSLYAPLIYQLKLACLISAGFLRAFVAAPASTNTTFLCKECVSHIHQHPPQLLHPGFPWRRFPASNLCFHEVLLWEIPSELYSPPPSKSACCASAEWTRAQKPPLWTPQTKLCSKPLPHFHLTWQISRGKHSKWKLFVPRWAQANRSASFFPSPDNVP